MIISFKVSQNSQEKCYLHIGEECLLRLFLEESLYDGCAAAALDTLNLRKDTFQCEDKIMKEKHAAIDSMKKCQTVHTSPSFLCFE